MSRLWIVSQRPAGWGATDPSAFLRLPKNFDTGILLHRGGRDIGPTPETGSVVAISRGRAGGVEPGSGAGSSDRERLVVPRARQEPRPPGTGGWRRSQTTDSPAVPEWRLGYEFGRLCEADDHGQIGLTRFHLVWLQGTE